MQKTFPKLRGRIVEKFGSQSAFAEALKTTDVTVVNKLNGKSSFSLEDIVNWCNTLDITKDEVGSYFFYDTL